MAFKKINGRGPDIKGFWNREGSFSGILTSIVTSNSITWYVVKVNGKTTAPLYALDEKEGKVLVENGDYIGVSNSNNLEALADLPKGTPIRLTSHGKRLNEKTGREFWDIEVEADLDPGNRLPF